MRTETPIDALLTRTVQGILSATLLQPERRWHLSELARHLRRSPSSLQRSLPALVRAGILVRRSSGNRAQYQADPRCPFATELRDLMTKTAGLVDVLRETLEPMRNRIELAFVYGSVARGEERSTSDVDLAVVGEVGLFELSGPLDRAEERIGRPIHAKVYTPREFEKKLVSGNHFLAAVIAGVKVMVIGGEEELERTRKRRLRRPARRESTRAG